MDKTRTLFQDYLRKRQQLEKQKTTRDTEESEEEQEQDKHDKEKYEFYVFLWSVIYVFKDYNN